MMQERQGEPRSDSRARAYFEKPAWRRILRAVWRKCASLGRSGGHAVVEQLTEAESEALNSFFGWNCRPGDTAKIPLALFDEELSLSGFAPMNIRRLHLLLEGAPLLTREERRLLAEDRWRGLFRSVRESAGQPLSREADEWLARLEAGQGAGGRTLRELYKTDPASARQAVEIVVRALNLLLPSADHDVRGFRQSVRLPVLAVQAAGDAHALDMNRPAGRMLAAVLRERSAGAEEEQGAAGEAAESGREEGNETAAYDEAAAFPEDGSETLKLREMYRRFGILDDDLSSIVHWYIPRDGEPALPHVWTLRQVEAAERLPRCSGLYVVENPAVFSTVLDRAPSAAVSAGADAGAVDPPALICTSGPASAAAIRWIERCLASSGDDCKLLYSGDFDVKGLAMGQTLADRFPGRFVPWRFDSETYLSAAQARLPGPLFDDSELAKLAKLRVSWDEPLPAEMIGLGRKVHQEAFVEALASDFWAYGGIGEIR